MRKINLMWLPTLLAGMLCSCNQQTEVEVMSDLTERSVGEVDKSSTVLTGAEWLLRNTGNFRLRVDSIKSSCECLEVQKKESMTAKPGGYFPVRVFLHPEQVDTGAFVREVEVYGNFPSSPLVLTLTGRIVDSSDEQCEP